MLASDATSKPATLAAPPVGFRRVVSIRTAVDFPAPLGPKNPNTSPSSTVRLMLLTATKFPKVRVRFSASIGLLIYPPRVWAR